MKKFLIWTIAGLIFLGGFFGMSLNQKARAAEQPIDLLGDCTLRVQDPNHGDLTIKSFNFSNEMKTAVFAISYKGNDKVYSFEFSKITLPVGGTIYTFVDYASTVYPENILRIRLTSDGQLSVRSEKNNGNSNESDDFERLMLAIDNAAVQGSCNSGGDLFAGDIQNPTIDFHGTSAPSITIPPWNAGGRPEMLFQLTHTQKKGGSALRNESIFVFTYKGSDIRFKKLAIRIFPSDDKAEIIRTLNPKDFSATNQVLSHLKFTNDASRRSLWLFFNHVYNPKGTGSSDCDASDLTIFEHADSDPTKDRKLADWPLNQIPYSNCLNVDDNGWLVKWGVDIVKDGTITDPTGEEEETCGVPITQGITKAALAKVLCVILKSMGDAAQWLIDTIFGSVFDAYHPPEKIQILAGISPFAIEKAQAENTELDASSIKRALSGTEDKSKWVLNSWKVMLGLANVFVVIVLLFLAITNILHIQYDTYAIKKSLPTLIFGVILANFSILITKMLVDSSNVLTATFMGQSAGDQLNTLITAVVPPATGAPGFVQTTSVWTLIIAIFFSFFAIVGFLILGFLFYIRYAVILALTVVAPLAFVLMAFPPTQGLFKQWWGWYAKFIFMKPVSLFLVWLAIQVLHGSGGNAGLSVWAISVFLIYAAIIIPFKMGGAVMGAWGALGKKGAGLVGKGAGYATAVQRAKLGNRWANTRFGRWKAGREQELETLEAERKTTMGRHKREIDEKKGGVYALRRKQMAAEEALGKTQEARFLNAFEKGEDTGLSARTLRKYTGARTKMELKEKYVKIDHDLGEAEAALKKREDIDSSNQAMFAMARHQWLMQQISDQTVTTDREGKELNYDNAQTFLSHLRNELLTTPETDQAKRRAIQENIDRVDTEIKTFEKEQTSANPQLNFAQYLDKNRYGRMQARVNPRLAEEMETILKSESIGQIMSTLQEGGGTAEFRFNAEDAQNYINGNFDKISLPARYGVQSYMMALQAKVGTTGIDQLEAISSMTKLAERAAPGTRTQIIRNAMEGMSTAGRQEMERELGKPIEEITDEDIRGFDMRPGAIQRDFARRLAVAIRSHPALGAAGSPGAYVGKSFAPGPSRAETLMKVNTDPAKLEGDVNKIIDSTPGGAEAILKDAEIGPTIVSLETDVIAKVKPTLVQIDDQAVRNQILEAVRDSGDDLAQLQSQLLTIHPNLRVSFDVARLPELKANAARALSGKLALSEIAKKAVIEETMPHFNLRVRQMDTDLLDLVEGELTDINAKIRQKIEANQSVSSDPTIGPTINSLLGEFGHTKMERDDIVARLDTEPNIAINLLKKKNCAIAAAKQIQHEFNQALENARTTGHISPTARERDIQRFRETIVSDPVRIKRIISDIVGATSTSPPPPPPPAGGAQGGPVGPT